MSQPTKVVIEKYPVNRLPEELRQGLGRDKIARVIIETVGEAPDRDLASFVGAGRGLYRTPEDAVRAIRSLRDEWE